MTFPESKKKKKNELSFSFVQEPVRSASSVRPGSIPKKKKKKRTLITFSKVKTTENKNEKNEKRTNLPFVRSGTVRSASSVRSGSIPKKKKKKEDAKYFL